MTSSARAEDEEAGDGDAPPKSCYKYTTDFMKSTTLTLLKCLGEKFKPKDFSEYITRSWVIKLLNALVFSNINIRTFNHISSAS